jgi:ribosome-binding factor A
MRPANIEKEEGPSRRVSRAERELRNLIATYVLTDLRGELSGLVTISRVHVPADMKMARIYVSIFGTPQEQEHSMKVLFNKTFEIQRHIARGLRLKFTPKLTFFLDDSFAQSEKIQRLLKEVQNPEI